MEFLVEGKTVYFDEFNDSENSHKLQLLQEWRERRVLLNCKCRKIKPYAKLCVKKRNMYFISNYKGQSHLHEYDCYFGYKQKGYKHYLSNSGINIDTDTQEIKVKLRLKKDKNKIKVNDQSKQRNQISNLTNSTTITLRHLLFTWLLHGGLNLYRNGKQRNISGRIYHQIIKTTINNVKMTSNNLYLASKMNNKYDFNQTIIAIGWGKLDKIIQSDNSSNVVIPFYSLNPHDDRNNPIRNIHVYNSIYHQVEFTNINVNEGYWVLYRELNDNKKLSDKKIIFIPACSLTGIPIHRKSDLELIKQLVEKQYSFTQPLFKENESAFDIETTNTIKPTIIFTKRPNVDIAELKQMYKEKGYSFLEYDPDKPLQTFTLGKRK